MLEEENVEKLNELCFKLIIADGILNETRELIQQHDDEYLERLPIFKKSTYYLAGYMYAFKKKEFDKVLKQISDAYNSENEQRLKGENFPAKIKKLIEKSFNEVVESFTTFYNNLTNIDKTDIDNLLKNKTFEKAYKKELEKLMGTLPNIED